MEIYLIRHGESTNNALSDARQRICDPPLTERGQQQARRVAERLQSLEWAQPQKVGNNAARLTHLYTSPMLRSLETAEAIRQATGLIPHVWLDLHEHGGIWLDYGDGRGPMGLPGMAGSEMQERFPHFILPAGLAEEGWWNRPWEDDASAFARAHRVAEALLQRAETDERLALVGHGAFGSSLISALLGLPFVPYERFDQHNAAISRLDLTAQRVRLRFLNRVEHLPPELIT